MEVCAFAFAYMVSCTRPLHLQVDTVAWVDAFSLASSLNACTPSGVHDPMEVSCWFMGHGSSHFMFDYRWKLRAAPVGHRRTYP